MPQTEISALSTLSRRHPGAVARTYDRARDLPRLIALWPEEISDPGVEGTTVIVEKLRAALRRERQRGRAGQWGYDLNRHKALLGCYRAEVRRLATLRAANRAGAGLWQMPRPRQPGSALPARPEAHLLGKL